MLLALDQGTTSCRTVAFAEDGSPLGSAQREFPQYFPADGQVEHDAEEILAAQSATVDEAWRQAGGGKVEAVGITNQRETVVVWERATGRPIHRAIVWQDRRTADRLATLRAHAGAVAAATGLPLDPYFSAAKIAWILDHVPGARRRAERGELCAGTIDAFLLFRLTGGAAFATEPSNACRTSLFDLRTGAFSQELCDLFGVPMRCLPEVQDSAGSFGTIAQRGWPITGVLGDQQAALFGHGCLRPGQGKCTYGTGAFVLQQAGDRVPVPAHGLLATVAWRIGGHTSYALEGSVLICGAAVQWLRDGLGLVQSSAEVEALARSVDDSGGVVFVPAFAGLGTPHWDPSARGTIVGLSRGTTRAHLARAAIEAMALQVDEVLLAMAASGTAIGELAVDGGAAANTLLLELQATIAGVPVVRPAFLETTVFGAFRMALLGKGGVARAQDLPGLPGSPLRVPVAAPGRPTRADVEGLRRRWQAAVARARGWTAV